MRRFMRLLIALLLGTPALSAAEQERCAALPTAAARIVCYDKQFPPESQPVTAATPGVASEPVAVAPDQLPAPQSPSAEPQAPVVAFQTDANATEPLRPSDKFERFRVDSTITAIHRRDQQAMIFLLANEQVWLQDSERGLPFHVGDAVTIKSGTFGGYYLTSDSGTKTRVRRIK